MKKYLVFGGTSEGRELYDFFEQNLIPAVVCTATDYGRECLNEVERNSLQTVRCHVGRLNQEEMQQLINRENITCVIDATHPYAYEVTKHCKFAANEENIPYFRIVRVEKTADDVVDSDRENCEDFIQKRETDLRYVSSAEEAVQLLNTTGKKALITTGSKELQSFTKVIGYKERLTIRVLPSCEVLKSCQTLGFSGRQILAMQGPFSEEMNVCMLKESNSAYLVTKESGASGGFEEKINAAKKTGATVIVIRRPQKEQGLSVQEMETLILKEMHQLQTNHITTCTGNVTENKKGITVPKNPSNQKQVTLIGIGMGNPETLTIEAKDAIAKAEVLIGAGRMLEPFRTKEKTCFSAIAPLKIKKLIEESTGRQFAILFSGDVSFFSGAKKLLPLLSVYEVKVLPGISSLSYLCAKRNLSYEDWKVVSIHGREVDLIPLLKKHRSIFLLTDGKINKICEALINAKFLEVQMTVAQNLSYPNETMETGKPKDFLQRDFSSLSVVLLKHESIKHEILMGIPEEQWIRGKVPMTKSEVRTIVLSKLKLKKNDIAYDIGAGTGSIAVEMGLLLEEGEVYAIETNPAGCELIHKNCETFLTHNVSVIEGMAPDCLHLLPPPTVVFIGGSKGRIEDILRAILEKSSSFHLVFTAITIETVSEGTKLLEQFGFQEMEVVQIFVAKSKKAGNSHMLMGQNPTFIVSAKWEESDAAKSNVNCRL